MTLRSLKIVLSGEATDNTEIGANVQVGRNTLKIKLPKSKCFGNFTVKIPKYLNLSVKETLNSYTKWQILGIKREVETETSYSQPSVQLVAVE
ncbi:MAG: hypothetical protein ACK4YV_03250 [Emticicia sp.]